MTTSSGPESKNVLETAKAGKEVVELVTWIISTGSAVLSFLQTPGNLTHFLGEVGLFGFTCYIAIWIALPIVAIAISSLDKTFQRETTDKAGAIIAAIAVLGGALLIRSTVVPGYVDSLDGIGTAFIVLLGIGTLSVPLLVWWYYSGSKPRTA